jgi:EmrB/QacA subfamily drug resistance transporter
MDLTRTTLTARRSSAEPQPLHARGVLTAVALAQLMIVLDGTIVAIALPQIQQALGFSNASLQWVVNAYALGFGGALLLAGRLTDRLGRRRCLIAGLVMFSLVSAVGGAAPTATVLVVARAVQGACAAVIAPAALGLLTTTFVQPRHRARAFAVYGSIGTAGAGIGLLLGGVLTSYADWRWTLYVNTPVGLLVAVLAAFAVPADSPSRSAAPSQRLDVPGAVLVTAGVTALVFGFVQTSKSGWMSAETLLLFAAALICFVAFAVVQTRTATPLLPRRLLANRSRAGCYVTALLAGGGVLGMFFFLSQYMQNVRSYTAIAAGAAFVPNIVAVAIGASVAERLIHRIRADVIVSIGLVLSAAGVATLGLVLRPDSTYLWQVLPANVVLCIGIGLTFVTLANITLNGIEHSDAGISSALFTACQQVGGAAGLALFATVAASVTARGADHALASRMTAGYDAGFLVAAVFFLAAAAVVAVFVRAGQLETDDEAASMVVL